MPEPTRAEELYQSILSGLVQIKNSEKINKFERELNEIDEFGLEPSRLGGGLKVDKALLGRVK